MSIFAGILDFEFADSISQSMVRDLAAAMTRNAADKPQLLEGPGYAFAKIDFGILGSDGAYVDDSGIVSLLAGVPLLADTRRGSTRQDELRILHDAWINDDISALQGSRGSFCAAHFDPNSRRLSLVCDKLGLRPIYHTVQGRYLIFSTALRILETISWAEKTIDVSSVAEIASLGYPLGNRSPYANISTVGAGAIVEAGRAGVRLREYWRWDTLPECEVPQDQLPSHLFGIFRDAVQRRLGDQRAVVACLSGGLDSRCVVSCLRQLGVAVHALNFGPAGSLDQGLGRLAADKLGTRYFELPEGPFTFWDRMLALHQSWMIESAASEVEHPRLVWAGDGGSVGLGHVYLTEEMISQMREGRTIEAVDNLVRHNSWQLPRRLFERRQRERVKDLPRADILEELSKLNSFDKGRNVHLFLMLNDQRRHLTQHFEAIDLLRFEVVTPFFDAEFLRLILTSPIDGFLKHRFYVRWLQEFSPETTAIPWQAYPGHEPCPLPVPKDLRWQWDAYFGKEERQTISRRMLAGVEKDLNDPRFPKWLLDKKMLRLAIWLTKLGIRDYYYLFKVARTFTRYSQ
jgi:hypothetical protein